MIAWSEEKLFTETHSKICQLFFKNKKQPNVISTQYAVVDFVASASSVWIALTAADGCIWCQEVEPTGRAILGQGFSTQQPKRNYGYQSKPPNTGLLLVERST
jgi:hypothetical protein